MSKEVFIQGKSSFMQDTPNTNWKHSESPTKPGENVSHITYLTLNAF